MKKNKILDFAINSIQKQAESLLYMANLLDNNFEKVVKNIYDAKGRVVITGIGKSAIIAQKIVATLNSTGTPALYLHAADALHGDLGMIQNDDVVMAISKSGETPEIKNLVPFLKKYNATLIAMTGQVNSYLAEKADYVLNTFVEKEVCPNNLAPTTSTTAQLVMGDALAVCLQLSNDFGKKDFAKFHPGGALGKSLYLDVVDILSKSKPTVEVDSDFKQILQEITKNRQGATVVLDKNKIAGIITDGDLRRTLELDKDIYTLKAVDLMRPNPKAIDKNEKAAIALSIMRNNSISQLVVSNKEGGYEGIVHIQDILKEGVF